MTIAEDTFQSSVSGCSRTSSACPGPGPFAHACSCEYHPTSHDLVRSGFLLFANLGHNTAVPGVDRFTNLSHLEVEQIGRRGGQVADIRNLASVAYQIAALDGGAEFLGCLGQVVS